MAHTEAADPTPPTPAGPGLEPAGTGVAFAVVFRGYDRRQVDEYVNALAARAARESSALRAAESRLAEDNGFSRPRAEADGELPGLGKRIETVLAAAEAEARALLAEAQADAEEARIGAQAVAAALRAAAEAEVAQLRSRAEAEVAELRAQAREEADARRSANPGQGTPPARTARSAPATEPGQSAGSDEAAELARAALAEARTQTGDLLAARAQVVAELAEIRELIDRVTRTAERPPRRSVTRRRPVPRA